MNQNPNGYGFAPPSPYGAAPAQPQQQQQVQSPFAPQPQAQNPFAPQQPSAYGAAPQAAQPSPSYAPPPAYGYAQPPQSLAPVQQAHLVQQPMAGAQPVGGKSAGLAVALELLGGTFLQTFGIGHLYTGRIGLGLGLMFGYWALTAINFFLCFVFIGFITWPICWLAMMILSPILASGGAKKANAKLLAAQQGY